MCNKFGIAFECVEVMSQLDKAGKGYIQKWRDDGSDKAEV